MAEGEDTPTFKNGSFDDNFEEQRDEVLALESIYEGGEVERLKILNAPSQDKEGLYTLHDHVLLTPDEDHGVDKQDCRVVSDSVDIGQTVAGMLQFNRFQLNVEFCRSTQECHVCCQELPGDEFFRLTECQHHFCHDCMTSYCKHHVSVGTVEKLRCPDTECDSVIPPHIVQSVLPADAFDRWERLMLQKTLENMTDMDWCPRCNNPVIREAEEDLNLGHCTTCIFSFCTLCRNPWHQGESCPEIEKQLAAEMRKNMSSTEKEKFEEKKKKLDEEIRSLISLQKETKLCPKCKVKIDKDGGCNMMRCRCGALFDWLVGLPTSNFNTGSCHKPDMRVLTPLVGDITPRNVDHVQRLLYGKQRDKANTPDDLEKASCPVCRYKNVKAGRNNHIKCQVCKTNYCFVCREKIVGVVTAHFTPGACPQHS